MAAPTVDEPVSFAQHIQPLFRPKDRQNMKFAFDLWDLEDVRSNAKPILGRLRAGTMPCDGGWSAENVDLFVRWILAGMPA